MDRKTIRNTWTQKEEILSIPLLPKSKKKHAVRTVKHDVIEAEVLEALKLYREKNVPVTGVLLRDEAMCIAYRHGVDDFFASNGWLEKFRIRNDVFFRKLHGKLYAIVNVNFQSYFVARMRKFLNLGESAAVIQAVVDEHYLELPSILTHYAPRDRLNADEFALFFRGIPQKSLLFAGESVHGGKVAKERVSVLVIGSAYGPEFPPIIIGSAAKPRAFAQRGYKEMAETKKLGFHYYNNKSSWMTMSIFDDILDLLNSEMFAQNRRVVLFVDNFSGHKVPSRTNMALRFFPPNITSVAQPLDAGIIKANKDFFRREMFEDIRKKLHTFTDVSEYIKNVTVYEACMWSVSALKSVKLSTWKNCFIKCRFVTEEDFVSTVTDPAENEFLAATSDMSAQSCLNFLAEINNVLAFY